MNDPSDPNHTVPPAGSYQTAQLANVAAAVRELEHPRQIGRYEVVRPIGEGGMGLVYQAEQKYPIRRTVAIKLIKLGMDTREVIARFESERQALAMMNHPNVARVLDAGATDAGRPYFVMEYVAGDPITTFADREKLTVRQRLDLFLQACAAVQHAHQKAIIHRDLKPSNILVMLQDGKPTVKVIDFGVAKALSQRLTERTLFTETGQLVGTPEYMPPEQADASTQVDVDTRSDVYSLGVVLYELLSGSLPFDARTLRSGGYNEIQRIIREVDPPRPSTRLSSLGRGADEVARLRQTPLDALARELRSELEWIPLKAMRKERDARYATAAELAEDIQNYLSNRPLRAGPESRAYRARKFLRRNRRAVVASSTIALLLVGGIVATGWQAVRAARAERRAVAASENLREVNRFLTEDLLASAAPDVSRGRELTVREAVDRAAGSVAERFRGRPQSEVAVRRVLAETYDSLGLANFGLPHAQAAYELSRRQHGDDHRETLESAHTLGSVLWSLSRYNEAETILRDAYERSRRLFGQDDDLTLLCLVELASTVRRQRRFDLAEPLYREALAATQRVYGPRSTEAANALNGVAIVLGEQDRDGESEAFLRESVELLRDIAPDSTQFLTTLSNLAKVQQNLGKIDEAESTMREALAGRRRLLKEDHPQTLISMNDLAWILADQKKFEEGEALCRETLERRRRVLGPDHRDTLQSMNALGRILTMQGRYAEAERVLQETVEGRRRVLGEQHAHTLGSMTHLATVYEKQERYRDAAALLAHVADPDRIKSLLQADREALLARYGVCLVRLDRLVEAEPLLKDARSQLSSVTSGAGLDRRRDVLRALATVYDRTDRRRDADACRAELASLSPTTAPGG